MNEPHAEIRVLGQPPCRYFVICMSPGMLSPVLCRNEAANMVDCVWISCSSLFEVGHRGGWWWFGREKDRRSPARVCTGRPQRLRHHRARHQSFFVLFAKGWYVVDVVNEAVDTDILADDDTWHPPELIGCGHCVISHDRGVWSCGCSNIRRQQHLLSIHNVLIISS